LASTLVSVNGRVSPAPAAWVVELFHAVPTRFEPASWQELQFPLMRVEA
jgi:hypothetical protein